MCARSVDELDGDARPRRSGGGDAISALAALMAPDGRIAKQCNFSYELRLHRARGYGALKAILEILAEEEGLTLTEISQRLQRTPGSTKDYLSWLEDVDLVTSRQKRYSFTDPLLRVWVRLHCRPSAPTEDDLAREIHRYALPRLPQPAEPPPTATCVRDGSAGGQASSRSIKKSFVPGTLLSRSTCRSLQPDLRDFSFSSASRAASCSASFLLGPVPSARRLPRATATST